jgi:hypothetical protein
MAIGIIKKPPKKFTMECQACGCVFTYECHNIVDSLFVTCPCCSGIRILCKEIEG